MMQFVDGHIHDEQVSIFVGQSPGDVAGWRW